jgi:hypothetical protein
MNTLQASLELEHYLMLKDQGCNDQVAQSRAQHFAAKAVQEKMRYDQARNTENAS